MTAELYEASPVSKRSETSALPSGWTFGVLTDLSSRLITYGIVQPGPNIPTGVPFIQTKDLTSGNLEPRTMDRTSHDIHAAYSRSAVSFGDIIIGIRASVGMVARVPSELHDTNISRGVARISPTQDVDGRFLYWALQSSTVAANINKEVKGSTYAEITLPALRGIKVPLPLRIEEQRAIAEALGDADALIESLEQLIAKKRQIKQGAMQELLTGKRRLPGFEGEWEIKDLGSVGRFRKGRNIPKSVVTTSGVPCVLYGEIYTRYDNVAADLASFISPEVAGNSEPIERGDILFAGSGETVEEIGKCFAYMGDETAYAGGDLIIMTPHEDNSEFLGYVLNSPPVVAQKAKLGQGSTVAHIYTSSLRTVEITLPHVDEQEAIASVFSDMDEELTALEAKLEKYRQIKQGMMHSLLTGKIRLV